MPPVLADGRRPDPRRLYLDLLKRCLTNLIYGDPGWVDPETLHDFSRELRVEGKDWPSQAHTMIGLPRLENLQSCVEECLRRNVPGDLIETGVWRGGATIFMRAVLEVWGDPSRTVWVADSFAGVPAPDGSRPADAGDVSYRRTQLAVPLEEVKENFRKYGLLDARVKFLAGRFRDTLPRAEIDRLALMRLDGDLYESTIDALDHLYPRLSPGGYVIVDDFGCLPACRQAVEDFRRAHGIREELRTIDWTGVYWMRS